MSYRNEYSAVHLNEKQADVEMRLKKIRKRHKADKDRSEALTDIFDEFEDEIDQEAARHSSKLLLQKLGVVAVSISTIGINVFAVLSMASFTVYIAGAVGSLVSAVIAIRAFFMEDPNRLVAAEMATREILKELAVENGRLSKQLEDCKLRAFCLKEAEERLNDMTKQKKINVRQLVGLVAEHRTITEEKRRIRSQKIMADLMKLVIKADKDESGQFDDDEIKRLVRYVKSLPAITVNERRLTKAVKKERSLHAVLELIHDISREDIPVKRRIFIINDEEIPFSDDAKGARSQFKHMLTPSKGARSLTQLPKGSKSRGLSPKQKKKNKSTTSGDNTRGLSPKKAKN